MYDEELEKVMLYYLIFENADYILDENDFTTDKNKKIIRAINELKSEKQEVSMIAVKGKIKANPTEVLQYLSTLSDYVFGMDVEIAYNKLISLSKKRKVCKLLQEFSQKVKDTEDIDVFIEKTVKGINDIRRINEKEKTFVEKVADATRDIEDKINQKEDYSLYTGMQDLDNILCGLHKQELTIIGARPRSW